MSLPSSDVAAPLFAEVGPEAFAAVTRWLQDVAADCAIETPLGQWVSPSVAWLADAVTFYDPEAS